MSCKNTMYIPASYDISPHHLVDGNVAEDKIIRHIDTTDANFDVPIDIQIH